MIDWPESKVGLSKPEKEPTTLDDMRREIDRGQRDSGLIYDCLVHARYHGMSGEDTYVLLAYRALRMLETIYAQQLEFVRCAPLPRILMTTDQPPDAP